jgi:CPA2 family monovalent cation:H+ antiporter-2
MSAGFVTPATGQLLILVTALTMMVTPPLEPLTVRIGRRVEAATFVHQDESEALEKLSDHVVIAGFGRVGRAAARQLVEAGVAFVAVDFDVERIARARELGGRAYFGDATRAEVLAAVGVDRARAVIIALDNPRQSLQLVMLLRYIFPTLKIYSRAYDTADAEELEQAGVTGVVREVVATGRQLANAVVPAVAAAEPPQGGAAPAETEAKGDQR